MIITCENCQSKFRLDDDRVKATGSKVRCSKCEHIFKVFPAPVEPVEQDPPLPVEDQLPPESLAESEEPQEDVVAEEQETSPDAGGDEENLDFDFLEEQMTEEKAPSEESLDFDLGDIELELGEGAGVAAEETTVSEGEELPEESLDFDLEGLGVEGEEEIPAEEAAVSEAIPEEESVDLGVEGLEEEQVPPEEVVVSEGEELPEESLELELEDLTVEDEDETSSEQATVSEDISPEEPEATDESLSLMSEEEGAEISEEKAEEITVDEEIGLELPDDGAMGTDTEDQELAPDKEDEEISSLVSEEEDFTLEDISDEEVGRDDVESASQWEEEEEIAPSEMKEMEEIPFDEGSEQPEEEEAEPSEEALAPATFQKKKRPSLALLILLIAVSIAGGIYAAITFLGPLKSGFTIPYLNIIIGGEKSGQVDAGNLKIALLNVKGDFEDNKEAGPIFIIQGHVRNDYSKDRSFVLVKGFLHDKSGKMVKTKSVYCGNILTKTELEDLPVAEINKKLLLQSGINQSNVKISPAKMVPFMVVFENLPGDLGEFSVEVEGSAAG